MITYARKPIMHTYLQLKHMYAHHVHNLLNPEVPISSNSRTLHFQVTLTFIVESDLTYTV